MKDLNKIVLLFIIFVWICCCCFVCNKADSYTESYITKANTLNFEYLDTCVQMENMYSCYISTIKSLSLSERDNPDRVKAAYGMMHSNNRHLADTATLHGFFHVVYNSNVLQELLYYKFKKSLKDDFEKLPIDEQEIYKRLVNDWIFYLKNTYKHEVVGSIIKENDRLRNIARETSNYDQPYQDVGSSDIEKPLMWTYRRIQNHMTKQSIIDWLVRVNNDILN